MSKISKSDNSVSMTLDKASKTVLEPYVTEKTFNLIEKENKLTFIVGDKSTKQEIIQAIKVLYEADAVEVNTLRTIEGKKAHIRFKSVEGARDLATKLGLV